MTRRFFYFISLSFYASLYIPFFATAQLNNTTWQPKIIDASSLETLETANISINNGIDYPINKEGLANIPLDKINDGDSVFISCMGYQTEKLYIKTKNNLANIIKLLPVSYTLKEVEISKIKKISLKKLRLAQRLFQFQL